MRSAASGVKPWASSARAPGSRTAFPPSASRRTPFEASAQTRRRKSSPSIWRRTRARSRAVEAAEACAAS